MAEALREDAKLRKTLMKEITQNTEEAPKDAK